MTSKIWVGAALFFCYLAPVQADESAGQQLRAGLAEVFNSNQPYLEPDHRTTFYASVTAPLSSVVSLGVDIRSSWDAQSQNFESAFLTLGVEPLETLGLRLDLGARNYHFPGGHYEMVGTTEEFVITGRANTMGFVSGLGAGHRAQLGSGFAFLLGSQPGYDSNWDLIVNRMDGSNNTASITFPVGAELSVGTSTLGARVGYRKLWGGGSAGAEFIPFGADLGFRLAKDTRLVVSAVLPGNLKTPDNRIRLSTQGVAGDDESTRVYDLYDKTLSVSVQTRL